MTTRFETIADQTRQKCCDVKCSVADFEAGLELIIQTLKEELEVSKEINHE